MYNFLTALTEINRSYTEQLKFFETYSSELVRNIQKRTEWAISKKQEDSTEKAPAIVLDFPKIPPHKTPVHSEEKDDITYMDFPHHNILNEWDYRNYSWKEFEVHAKEIAEIYEKNLRIVTHNFPRYIRRYWSFVDQYISLLEKLHALWKNKFEIKKEGNVYVPYALSQEKNEYDSTLKEIKKMEERWENEKIILRNGIENTYQANLVAERYWSMLAYTVDISESKNKQAFTDASSLVEKSISDNIILLGMIKTIEFLSPSFYKQKPIDELRLEHENVRRKILLKNTPRS